MKRLKHLLWIIPLLVVAVALVFLIVAANARATDRDYHAKLNRSMQVTSTDFSDGQEMPTDVSCRGAGRTPQLRWSGAPADVKSYVLLATDWEVPSPAISLFAVSHWVVYNIPPDFTEMPANSTTEQLSGSNLVVGAAMGGATAYLPPCPPLGQHHYEFRVYALDVADLQPASNDKAGVLAAIDGHVLGYGELVGLSTAP